MQFFSTSSTSEILVNSDLGVLCEDPGRRSVEWIDVRRNFEHSPPQLGISVVWREEGVSLPSQTDSMPP